MKNITIYFIILIVISLLHSIELNKYTILKSDGTIDPVGLNLSILDIYTIFQPRKFNKFNTIPDANQIGEQQMVLYRSTSTNNARLYTIIDNTTYYVRLGTIAWIIDSDSDKLDGYHYDYFATTITAYNLAQATGTNRTSITALEVSTGTLRNEVNTSTGTQLARIVNLEVSTGTLRNETITSTASLVTSIASVQTNLNTTNTSTGTLRNEVNTSTGAQLTRIVALETSTGTLVAMDNTIKVSTGTLRNEVNTSTGTQLARIVAIETSTGTLRNEVNTSTGTQLARIVNLEVSTGTLVSTGTTQTISGIKTFTSDLTISSNTFVSGNLGVGWSTPGVPLDVVGSIRSRRIANSARILELSNELGDSFIGYPAGAGYSLLFASGTTSSYTEFMRISASGDVGIGTESPTYPLDIYKPTLPRIRLTNSATGTATTKGLHIYQNGINTVIDNKSGYILFYSSDTYPMILDGSGNLGIGLTTPDQLLTMEAAGGVGGYYDAILNTWVTGSSYRYMKQNIQDFSLTNPLDILKNIKIKKFQYKNMIKKIDSVTKEEVLEWEPASDKSPYTIGFIRNEVPAELIGTVITDNGGLDSKTSFSFTVLMLQAQQKKIDELENRIRVLENKINE